MQKLITAGAALLLVGIGAFSVANTDAQRATCTTQGEIIEEEGKLRIVEKVIPPEGVFTPRNTRLAVTDSYRFVTPAQPGTWQVVTHDDVILLVNTATGETFHLEDNDEGLYWKPIPRPGLERRVPRMPEMPRMPRERADRDGERMSPEAIERRMDEIRRKMKEARGEARDRLERALEELEREHEDRDEPHRDRDHEEELAEIYDEIEEKIGDLKDRWKESDSVRERERLEKAIKELKEEAERIREELKERRR